MSTDKEFAIGGYFSLELPSRKEEFHKTAIKVNSGKNAFEYILCSFGSNIKKVYLPYFTSRIMIKPLNDNNIAYQFYNINEKLEIKDKIELKDGEFIVYTNYFGLKSQYISNIASDYGNKLIIDNAQAFFDRAIEGVSTFYSPRKFFGVSDGGYAYTMGSNSIELKETTSYERMGYLLHRIDTSAEEAFYDYKSSCHLGCLPIAKMSKITKRILESIDYESVAETRQKNFQYLADELNKNNKFNVVVTDSVPMVYPYLCKDTELRSFLIKNRIYVAQYWPNVLEWCNSDSLEFYLSTHMVPLPIDQRYGIDEMKKIISIINLYEKE